ncbi:MAG TPA: NAD(+)/NADH kinase [Planctomycetota bacterium]|nr:NAD(+)/NADH kinase [Planctomycetota bacterium]
MRVLVVFKRSFLEAHRRDRGLLRRLSPADRARLRRADLGNRAALRDVLACLRAEGAEAKAVNRADLPSASSYDLIVAVGGDGTFLQAAHFARATPVLGINSDPPNSLGLFAAADRTSFAPKLRAALQGKLPATRLNRLLVEVNGEARPELALNDVLVAHRTPASLSRYAISIDGGAPEIQRSSGLWISTAAGSTAAIRAAGGKKMAVLSRRIQHLTREPYSWPVTPRRRRGFADRSVNVLALMGEASLWIDGPRTRVDLVLGDHVRVSTGAEPVSILGFNAARRERLFP